MNLPLTSGSQVNQESSLGGNQSVKLRRSSQGDVTETEDIYASSFASKISNQSKISGALVKPQKDTLDIELEKHSVTGGAVPPEYANSSASASNHYLKQSQASSNMPPRNKNL